MNFIQYAALFASAMPAFLSAPVQADDDIIPVRVVVITTFQFGDDNDPTAGEFGNWVLNLPLPQTIPFPQGYHQLRYNPELQVLGIVTGEGKSHAAASIMGLGMDPRFDLSKAYWIVAAIAGVDPNKASVASTAWANSWSTVISLIRSMPERFHEAGLPATSPWDVRALIKGPPNHSIPMVFNRFISSMRHSSIGLSS